MRSSFVRSSSSHRRLPLRSGLAATLVCLAVRRVAGAATTVRDGNARFTVLSASLVRAEYVPAARFEDRPTLTTVRRDPARVRVKTRVRNGWREITTSRLTLRWRRGSTAFTPATLRLRFRDGRRAVDVGVDPGAERQVLGGWTRGLDLLSGPVALNPGILNRDGWHAVDDTGTAVRTTLGSRLRAPCRRRLRPPGLVRLRVRQRPAPRAS